MLTEKQFNIEWRTIAPNLKHFILRLTNNKREDAEDFLQDTYINAYTNFEKYDEKKSFKTWIFNIARNRFIDDYRKKKNRRDISATITDEELEYRVTTSARNHGADCFVLEDYADAVKKLDPRFRIPFELFESGFRYEEIAEMCKLPIGTVKNRIFNAKKEMQKNLQEYCLMPREEVA